MGLDMFLYSAKYEFLENKGGKNKYILTEELYWKKDYALYNWFRKNILKDKDCNGMVHVSKYKLEKLLKEIENAFKYETGKDIYDLEEEELNFSGEGFYNCSECWYGEDMWDTYMTIKKLLSDDCDEFYFSSSY